MAVSTTHPIYLAGAWEEGDRSLEVRYPFDDRLVGTTSYASAQQARRAVEAAAAAFRTNRRAPAYERKAWLQAIRGGIDARRQEFAELMTLENGKPIKDSLVEVDRAIITFETAAEEAVRINGEVIPLDVAASGRGRAGIVRRFPIGPILAITPFNFPLNLPAHKIAPALAAGNSVIVKPASKTPLTMLKLAEVVHGAGLPAGMFQVLPMDHEVAELLLRDDAIKMLTFTGSSVVGWDLKARSGKKRVLMELGGNAAVLVDHDADLRHAAQRIVAGGFVYAGQTCISVQRVLIHQRVYEPVARDVVELTEKLVVGDPLDPATDVGPVIDDAAAERITAWIDEAVEEGARVLAGGKAEGRMIQPTVLADAPPTSKVCREEAFAPLVSLSKFADFHQALRLANDTSYGLQAGVFTQTLDHALDAFDELEVGGVMVNEASNWRIDPMPYGGVKDSGFGREGLRYAIQEMTEPKLLAINRA